VCVGRGSGFYTLAFTVEGANKLEQQLVCVWGRVLNILMVSLTKKLEEMDTFLKSVAFQVAGPQ